MCSQKFRNKDKPFVPKDKMTKYVLRLYIYTASYILWFSDDFNYCSKSVSEIRYTRPMIFVGDVRMHKMSDVRTKLLSATFFSNGQLKVFLGPCGWRNSSFRSSSCTFTSATMQTHQNVSQIQLMKSTWCFYIYFFGQWLVKIRLKTLYFHLWVFE